MKHFFNCFTNIKKLKMPNPKRDIYELYKDMEPKPKFHSEQEEIEYEKITKKKCRICKEELFRNMFSNNTSGSQPFDRDGYRLKRNECKVCQKNESKGKREAQKIAERLGIEKPSDAICKLCGSSDKIVFDHCHKTKVFRGWLCDPCNRSLGVLGDNVESLLKCINYMNVTEQKEFIIENNILKI